MNDFTSLAAGSFSRLRALRELTLQNNHLSQFPAEALETLRDLRSLRLDANSLSTVPRGCFKGLGSLRYLWMDDNRLTQVPVAALASLPALQALTLALNHISHLPDLAFHTLRHLLVLHLHNNQICSLAERCFDGLHNLETLDLSSNTLDSFPTTIRALPSLHDLDLSFNRLSHLPLGEELSGLTRLSLAGNLELRVPLPPHLLPRVRTAEMPCGFQCRELPCVGPGGPHPMGHCRTENALLLQGQLSFCPPWMAHFCVWVIFIPSIALNCLVLTLVFLPNTMCRTTAAQRFLLATLFCLRLLTGLCGTGLALAEDLQSSPGLVDLLSSQACVVVLLSSQACVVVLMTAVVLEHRTLWDSVTPAAQRLAGAAASVLVAVVLCCSATLALLAAVPAVWEEGGLVCSIRRGPACCWEYNRARVTLNCCGYLLLTPIHTFFCFCYNHRDRVTTRAHAVTSMLLVNTLLSIAEALLWWSEGSSVMCPPPAPPILQPAGGSLSLLLLLAVLPAVLDPLLYTLLHLGAEPGVGQPGDRKH
ncbi:unnamed protein product [Merluccius merluccius]